MNKGQHGGSNGKSRMTIEGLNSALEERGVIWQGSGFALVGAFSLPLLWIYSEADHWSIGIYRLAVTQLNWAFVIALALVIEGIRKMFETRTEIRRAARERYIAKEVEKRLRWIRDHPEVELPREVEMRLLKEIGNRKWWHRILPFRSW